MPPRTIRRLMLLGVLAPAAFAAACTPTVRRHGYVPESEPLTAITAGEDTRTTVLARYGNPSTAGVFEDNIWYYVTDVRSQLGFLEPESSARLIVVVEFDDEGVVSSVDSIDLDEAREVALVDRQTPTRGRELTILEQILGNVGRLPTDQLGGQDNLPGGAGGPRRE